MRDRFSSKWREDPSEIFSNASMVTTSDQVSLWDKWRNLYSRILKNWPLERMEGVRETLRDRNPKTALLRPVIESVWEPIEQEDNWQPFYDLLQKIQSKN